jgi:hypothetical protein
MVCQWFGLKTTDTVCQCFGLKTNGTVFSSFTSKLVATASPGLASKPMVDFLVWPQNQGQRFLSVWPQNQWWLAFSALGIKIDSYSLVICVSKSPRWFIGLGLKTKQTSVCRLHHKTDGGRLTRDTHQDLTACFT